MKQSIFTKIRTQAVAVILLITAISFLSIFHTAKVNAVIINCDGQPLLQSSDPLPVNESDGKIAFRFSLSNPQARGSIDYATEDGTAIAATDYVTTVAESVDIPPGGEAVVEVPVINDSISEVPITETFNLVITGGTGFCNTQDRWPGTIIDDDPVPTPIPPTSIPPTSVPPTGAPGPTATPGPGPTSPPGPAPTSVVPTKKVPPKVFIPFSTPIPTDAPEPTEEPEPTTVPEVKGETEEKPPQRSEFVRSVLDFTQLPFTLQSVVQGLFVSGFLILLIMFPAELFNSTVQSNYDEIIGWFWIHKLQQFFKRAQHIPHITLAIIYGVLSAIINSLLSPDFGFNKSTFALIFGMFIALVVGATLYDVVRSYYMKRKFGIRSRLRPHSFGVIMGALLVLSSRLGNFLPGYCYGLFTGLVYNKQPKDKDEGKGLAISAVLLLGVALAAWFLWVPFKKTMGEDPSFLALTLDAAMASLWVSALCATVFGLAPLRFVYGEQVKKWNSFAWVAIYFFGVYLFVYTLLNPAIGIYGKSDKANLFSVLALFLGFGGFSFLFWGYFRYRHLWQGARK